MAESKLRELSTDFAVKVIKTCDGIKGHYSLVNQLERSSTSIGANIHEANYAHSKADFVAKLQIALKECYETEYWIELFVKSELIERETAKELYNQCGSIRRMLIASINTAKENNSETPPLFLFDFSNFHRSIFDIFQVEGFELSKTHFFQNFITNESNTKDSNPRQGLGLFRFFCVSHKMFTNSILQNKSISSPRESEPAKSRK